MNVHVYNESDCNKNYTASFGLLIRIHTSQEPTYAVAVITKTKSMLCLFDCACSNLEAGCTGFEIVPTQVPVHY